MVYSPWNLNVVFKIEIPEYYTQMKRYFLDLPQKKNTHKVVQKSVSLSLIYINRDPSRFHLGTVKRLLHGLIIMGKYC